MLLSIINVRAVQKALLSLHTGLAYGPDILPFCALKEIMSGLEPVLARLFHFCLKTKSFPSF